MRGQPAFPGSKVDTSKESSTRRAAQRGECDVQVAATATDGQPIAIPEASTLTFGCGSDEPRFSLYVSELTAGVRVPSECQSPRLVAGWPIVMGLPPGSFELGPWMLECLGHYDEAATKPYGRTLSLAMTLRRYLRGGAAARSGACACCRGSGAPRRTAATSRPHRTRRRRARTGSRTSCRRAFRRSSSRPSRSEPSGRMTLACEPARSPPGRRPRCATSPAVQRSRELRRGDFGRRERVPRSG